MSFKTFGANDSKEHISHHKFSNNISLISNIISHNISK